MLMLLSFTTSTRHGFNDIQAAGNLAIVDLFTDVTSSRASRRLHPHHPAIGWNQRCTLLLDARAQESLARQERADRDLREFDQCCNDVPVDYSCGRECMPSPVIQS